MLSNTTAEEVLQKAIDFEFDQAAEQACIVSDFDIDTERERSFASGQDDPGDIPCICGTFDNDGALRYCADQQ